MLSEKLKLEFDEWYNTLDKDEIEALQDWTNNRYKKINFHLRELNFDEIPNEVKNLIIIMDKSLEKYQLSEEINVFRTQGEKVDITLLKRIKKFTPYKNFVSTSISFDCAIHFLNTKLRSENIYKSYSLLDGIVEIGINCGFLNDKISFYYKDEKEILLMRNISFEINEKEEIEEDVLKFKGKFKTFNYGL